MDFRVINTVGFPNRFLVVVDTEQAAERFRATLPIFSLQAELGGVG